MSPLRRSAQTAAGAALALALAGSGCASSPPLPPLPPVEPPAGIEIALGHAAEPAAARLRADGAAVSCAAGEPALVWRADVEAPVGRTLERLPDDLADCAPDGASHLLALTEGGVAVVYDLGSGEELGRFSAPGAALASEDRGYARLLRADGTPLRLDWSGPSPRWAAVEDPLPPGLQGSDALVLATDGRGRGAALSSEHQYYWEGGGASFRERARDGEPVPDGVRSATLVDGAGTLLLLDAGGGATVWGSEGAHRYDWPAPADASLSTAAGAPRVLARSGCTVTWYEAASGAEVGRRELCAAPLGAPASAEVEGDALEALRSGLRVDEAFRSAPVEGTAAVALIDEEAREVAWLAPRAGGGWIAFTPEGRWATERDGEPLPDLRVWVGTESVPASEAGWAEEPERVRRALTP